MIVFSASIRKAEAMTSDAITTNSVGIPVDLQLSEEFAGLAKTVVFWAGDAKVDVALVGDATDTVVPPDVLAVKGKTLLIGIYAADGSGDIVIPTVWAPVAKIQEGAVPSGVDPAAATPSWVAQVQGMASEALEMAEAVAAAAARGDFDGDTGPAGPQGTTFTPAVSDDGVLRFANDGGKQNPPSVDMREAVLAALRWVDKINPDDGSLLMRAGDSFWLRGTCSSPNEFASTDTITLTIYTEIGGQVVTSVSAARSEIDVPPKNEIWLPIDPSLTKQMTPGDYAYALTVTLNGESHSAGGPALLRII